MHIFVLKLLFLICILSIKCHDKSRWNIYTLSFCPLFECLYYLDNEKKVFKWLSAECKYHHWSRAAHFFLCMCTEKDASFIVQYAQHYSTFPWIQKQCNNDWAIEQIFFKLFLAPFWAVFFFARTFSWHVWFLTLLLLLHTCIRAWDFFLEFLHTFWCFLPLFSCSSYLFPFLVVCTNILSLFSWFVFWID